MLLIRPRGPCLRDTLFPRPRCDRRAGVRRICHRADWCTHGIRAGSAPATFSASHLTVGPASRGWASGAWQALDFVKPFSHRDWRASGEASFTLDGPPTSDLSHGRSAPSRAGPPLPKRTVENGRNASHRQTPLNPRSRRLGSAVTWERSALCPVMGQCEIPRDPPMSKGTAQDGALAHLGAFCSSRRISGLPLSLPLSGRVLWPKQLQARGLGEETRPEGTGRRGSSIEG